MLKAVGASAAVAAFAGCLSDDDDGADDEENGDDDAGGDGIEIDPGTTIMLEGITGGWEGLEPEEIAGETNPTLLLQEGETYEIGWEQGDGSQHNVEIWDADEEMVEEYGTELTGEPEEVLEFTASDEMAYYRCDPHPNMQGEIQVE
ncbi:cupredoxin domain-containing protein [Natronococcus pandeyae]|nr:hypothetical protein [Natronococcus pandeyae]